MLTKTVFSAKSHHPTWCDDKTNGRVAKMFCSTIIPTVGRKTLNRAVQSLCQQTFTEEPFEVIVVNDSGRPLPTADWHKDPRITILNTQQHERCIARNAGAAIAKGQYLHFLDDDDWLYPHALQQFWQLAQATNGAWLYGGSQLVNREGKPIIKLFHQTSGNCFTHVIAGEWFPLQSSLIQAQAFFRVGGFHPLIPGAEDIDLTRRIALHEDLVSTEDIIANVVMGEEGSTTDYLHSQKMSQWARESILDQPGAFERLHQSAKTSYWQGRIVRAYTTSLYWNLERRRLYTAMSRAVSSVRGMMLAWRYLLSPKFWQALIRKHESENFLKGFLLAGKPVERRVM